MENKIIIAEYDDVVLVIDKEDIKDNKYIDSYFFDYYSFSFEDCESWEEVEWKAEENLDYHVDGMVPIYYNQINKQFNRLEDWRIDDLVNEYNLELGDDFSRFKQMVLYYDMYQEAWEELSKAIEAMEEIEA